MRNEDGGALNGARQMGGAGEEVVLPSFELVDHRADYGMSGLTTYVRYVLISHRDSLFVLSVNGRQRERRSWWCSVRRARDVDGKTGRTDGAQRWSGDWRPQW